MNYYSIITKNLDYSNIDIEIVERKGIGHPDTLADLIAEMFANDYSILSLKKFGLILNHCSDDVVLSGGVSNIKYGSFDIKKPIKAYLFGKAITEVGDKTIDIHQIFTNSVQKIFKQVFNTDTILKHIECVVDSNNGIGLEHPKDYYQPSNIRNIKNALSTLRCNDTVFCSGYAPYSFVEVLTINIENYICSKLFKKKFPQTGWDVKVMSVRVINKIDITICVPFIAKKVKNHTQYKKNLTEVKKDIYQFIKKQIKKYGQSIIFDLSINTKDRENFGYVTSFGTALDKGDNGTVGRGNKYTGLISLIREANIEAVNGKNALHYSGKLYTILAHNLAHQIYQKYQIPNYVNISGKNGHPLNNPAFIIIKGPKQLLTYSNEIKKIIDYNLSNLDHYTKWIVQSDPIQSHISVEKKLCPYFFNK